MGSRCFKCIALGLGYRAKLIWLCFFGPRLKRIFYKGTTRMEDRPYIPTAVERRSDKLISSAQLLLSLIYHTLPLIIFYYALKEVVGTPRFMNLVAFLKEYTAIPVIFFCLFIFRGLGRMANKDYREFLICLINAQCTKGSFKHHDAVQSGINKYDFEMSHHPVSFSHSDATIKPRTLYATSESSSLMNRVCKFPSYVLSYVLAHMFGWRLMYPGSLALTNAIMAPYIENGRAKHITQRGGIRAKLLAADGNYIDAIFLDKRIDSLGKYHYGNKLVICCEGNASFYEVGMIEVPIDGGFSVLGWNHPGFAESSGLPFPSEESNAIDVVIKYVVCELEFSFEDIIIYGWSIGGYTASWAAMSYPKISAVVMDATFDHVLPLAQSKMPSFGNIVDMVIKNCMNLNVAEQLCYYPGPVFLIRRELDELTTTSAFDLKTNRINSLLVHLLQNRYPYLVSPNAMEELQNWINAKNSAVRNAIDRSMGVNRNHCYAVLNDYMAVNGCDYPCNVGKDLGEKEKLQLLLYLAGQYFTSCELKHNDPLPLNMFRIPLTRNLQFFQSEA